MCLMKKLLKLVLCLILPVVLLLAYAACSPGGANSGGLSVIEMNASIGAVFSTSETQRLTYRVTLKNNSAVNIYIDYIEPVVIPDIDSRVLLAGLIKAVGRSVASGGTIEVSGSFTFDATGLSKQDIDKMQPIITGIRVVSDQTLKIPGK